jgi:glycosyltransferase involved in cell wall biosynthesis
MFFSVVIPVYNRPDEVDELLRSLCEQTATNFEVIIVEDGSTIPCKSIVEKYSLRLSTSYFSKENTGPGTTRNYGAQRSNGDYIIFFDSDCIIPPTYFQCVNEFLSRNAIDAFGGPDKAHPSFTVTQKAINYSMTSFFTTGGIRGGNEKMDKFFPRSFNMGFSREVFNITHGFSTMRFGEDIDMSIRILACNFKTALIKDAFVYHKRRTDLKKFFKQVFNSGMARINLFKKHPNSLKFVHLLPTMFVLGTFLLLILSIFCTVLFLAPLGIYILAVFLDSLIRNRSFAVALKSILASFVQLFGYGTGFIAAFWKRIILGKPEASAFVKNFYK